MEINKVKQYLARGISVLVTMNTQITSDSKQILSNYAGDVPLTGFPCEGISNHQVVIVGYGKFKRVPVWIVKNSWGSDWGNYGHMYVEMGTNQFCIETSAYAIIPKNYDETQGVFSDQYETPFDLMRGENGLDIDTTEDKINNVQKQAMSTNNILMITSILVVIIGVGVGVFFVVLSCIKNKK